MNHTEIFAGQLKALAHTEKTCSFAFFFFFFWEMMKINLH